MSYETNNESLIFNQRLHVTMKTNVTETTLSNGHQSSSSGIGDMDIHTQACARVMPQQFKPTPGVEVCYYILQSLPKDGSLLYLLYIGPRMPALLAVV